VRLTIVLKRGNHLIPLLVKRIPNESNGRKSRMSIRIKLITSIAHASNPHSKRRIVFEMNRHKAVPVSSTFSRVGQTCSPIASHVQSNFCQLPIQIQLIQVWTCDLTLTYCWRIPFAVSIPTTSLVKDPLRSFSKQDSRHALVCIALTSQTCHSTFHLVLESYKAPELFIQIQSSSASPCSSLYSISRSNITFHRALNFSDAVAN
jgi:hypothetical protein